MDERVRPRRRVVSEDISKEGRSNLMDRIFDEGALMRADVSRMASRCCCLASERAFASRMIRKSSGGGKRALGVADEAGKGRVR